jgi:hypothetical protein
MIIGSNTKINVFIDMVNTEVLSEKIKYLIITEAGKDFNIISASIDDVIYFDFNNKTIKSYYVDIRFDYLGSINPDVRYFGEDLRKMSDKVRDIVGKYVLNSKGKIVSGGENVTIGDGVIFSFNYIVHESQEFAISFKVTIISED